MAVLVRLAGREFGEAGALTTQEAVAAAPLFVAAGADAIHVTGWGRNSFANFTEGPLPDTVGAYRDLARQMKDSVDVPVIAVGRVLPELAEEMVAAGDCDFVAMGRQLLTDPSLVAKLAAGRRAEIRPCINCYVCVEQNFWDDAPHCAVNPALGDETAVDLPPVDPARHVVVVGGGPAGMEVARLAAARGHRVTLVEASARLGGTAWFSQLTTPPTGRSSTGRRVSCTASAWTCGSASGRRPPRSGTSVRTPSWSPPAPTAADPTSPGRASPRPDR